MRRVYENLSDHAIEVTARFVRDPLDEGAVRAHFMWDTRVKGLRVRIGKHKATWSYYREYRQRGVRKYVPRTLGWWPNMNVAAARRAAMDIAPKARTYSPEPDRVTFAEAFEEYLKYLREKRSEHWARNVANLGKNHLLPRWGHFTIAEMSEDPVAISQWHEKLSKTIPVTANKCAKLIRVVYRFAARKRRGLPPELPTSAVVMNEEEARQVSMSEAQHREWFAAWQRIEDAGHRSYWLLMILSGLRPGELARLRSEDVEADHFTIRKTKSGVDHIVPISPQMRAALDLAPKRTDGFVFPARKIKPYGLPVFGHGLRHNYKTIAVSMSPPVPEVLIELLQGHAVRGTARKYMEVAMVSQSEAMMDAQRRMSARIAELLGLDLTLTPPFVRQDQRRASCLA